MKNRSNNLILTRVSIKKNGLTALLPIISLKKPLLCADEDESEDEEGGDGSGRRMEGIEEEEDGEEGGESTEKEGEEKKSGERPTMEVLICISLRD